MRLRLKVFNPSMLSMTFVAALCLLGVADLTRGASAEEPACKRAEVNPITGHVLCIDPLGAAVSPPPKADPCDTDQAKANTEPPKDGDWTFRPSCTETEGS